VDKSIFISHASVDKPRLAPYIARLLEKTDGLSHVVRLWIDRPAEIPPVAGGPSWATHPRINKIPSGTPWMSVIQEQVANSDCVLVFLSDRAEPERKQVFGGEIVKALFDHKCVAVSLDPMTQRDPPDLILGYVQITDVSKFADGAASDDGAFDSAIDQIVALIEPRTTVSAGTRTVAPSSIAPLVEAANKQRKREIALISSQAEADGSIVDKKYLPSLYVQRPKLTSAFEQFKVSEDVVFPIVGDAGMGKTNFLCNAAEAIGREHPTFFFHGAELASGLMKSLNRDLKPIFLQDSTAPLVSTALDLAESHQQELYIFIDGLNECALHRAELRLELNEFVREAEGKPLRIVVSCRTGDWDYWTRNDNNMMGRFGRAVFTASRQQTATLPSASLFDEKEFEEAWSRYEKEYNLRGPLSPRMRLLCREPFMLRLVSEIYRNGARIPEHINAQQVFERFIAERYPTASAQLGANTALARCAELMLDGAVPFVNITNFSERDRDAVMQLVSDGILLVRGGQVIFQFELFLEFVLSRHFCETVPPNADASGRAGLLARLARNRLINTPGVVEGVLLRWQEHSPVITAATGELIAQDDRMKATVCSAIRKMDNVSNETVQAIEALAEDDNPVIRDFYGQAVGHHEGDVSSFVVERLLQPSRRWEARETAANIIGSYHQPLTDETTRQLWHMSDDFHWRVRRAAGYSLSALMRNCDAGERASVEDALEELEATSTWKHRHALCIAFLSAGGRVSDVAARVITRFATDPNHQVRFLVANYLRKYVQDDAAAMQERIARDPAPWVRARGAVALVTMARENGAGTRPRQLLAEMANDPSKAVRSRLARELAKAGREDWAVAILLELLQGEFSVAIAAAYSLDQIGFEGRGATQIQHHWHTTAGRTRVLAERIARGDVNFESARFSKIQELITTRTEFRVQTDSYMRVIDTMCSLIASTASAMAGGVEGEASLFDLLLHDEDEGVRWALVQYLATYGADLDLSGFDDRFRLLEQLASDPHFWVRREVAIALEQLGKPEHWDKVMPLLMSMRRNEDAFADPCSDEVLHFVDTALYKVSGTPTR
jgi:HEAT repeat protein